MAVWRYDPATGQVTRDEGRRLVAGAVSDEDGPLIAEAPAMEAVLRELVGILDFHGVRASASSVARAILRRIDEGRKGDS